jgi:hypothetical protein
MRPPLVFPGSRTSPFADALPEHLTENLARAMRLRTLNDVDARPLRRAGRLLPALAASA